MQEQSKTESIAKRDHELGTDRPFCPLLGELVLLASVVAVLIVYTFSLSDGHNWGDDWGLYMHLGYNISEGKSYSDSIESQLAPPGLPAIIGLLMYAGVKNLAAFKMIGLISLAIFVFAQFYFFSLYFPRLVALPISLFSLTLFEFFMFIQNILSDIPFASSSLLALLSFNFCLSAVEKKTYWTWFVVGIGFGILSLSLRAAGLTVWLAVLVVFSTTFVGAVAHMRARLTASIVILVIVSISLVLIFQFTLHAYLWQYSVLGSRQGLIELVATRLDQEISSLGRLVLFSFDTRVARVLSILCLAGFISKIALRKLDIFDVFFIIYLATILRYPAAGGPRYLFPILPMILAYLAFLLWTICYNRWTTRLSASMPFHYLVPLVLWSAVIYNSYVLYNGRHFNDDEIGSPSAKEMLQWVETATIPRDLLLAFKPRSIAYLSKRRTQWLPTSPSDIEKIASSGAKFAVSVKYYPTYRDINNTLRELKPVVFENSDYVVFGLDNEKMDRDN
jgi:cytochrome c oxidase subunit 4